MSLSTLRPVLFSLLPLALGVGACVDDGADSGLTVLKAVPPDPGCTFTAGGDLFVASGLIESDAGTGYLLAPELRNDITLADGESATPKTVFVTGAHVTITFYDDKLFDADTQAQLETDGLTRFLAPMAGPVEPNAGTAVFPFQAVPGELIAKIDQALAHAPGAHTLLDVKLQFTGTRGGSDIESNVFHFPVEVCDDCVVSHLGACTDLSSTAVFGTGGACNALQDGHLDCCTGVDPDELEVDCMDQPPPAGMHCSDGINEPPPDVCPAHQIEL
ncbi:MAG TPA: hypothetical protein VHE35_06660 [Kofleriaceae bacterium]|nr:hypothetical protein [Kofleriaceae bacterium]